MNATELRNATLKQLRGARTQMLSSRWVLVLENEDEETRNTAAQVLLEIQHAIRRLENQQLAAIRDALVANEDRLTEGRRRLEGELKNLERVTEVLSAAAKFLGVVGRIVDLLFGRRGENA